MVVQAEQGGATGLREDRDFLQPSPVVRTLVPADESLAYEDCQRYHDALGDEDGRGDV